MSRIPIVALLALLAVGCAARQGASNPDAIFAPGTSAARISAISRFSAEIDGLRRELRIPGLAVAVVRDRSLAWADGFGYADLAWKVKATPHTPFHLASLTKPIAATLLMQLVEKGTVGLYDPLAKWGIRLGGPGTPQVWHLLSHTSSGVPGESFQYDGYRYALLAAIIGRASGFSFGDRLYQRILKPLGMTETAPNAGPSWDSFLVSLGIGAERRGYARVWAELARPYRVTDSFSVVPGSYPLEQSPSAGLMSSVLDLAKLDVALDSGALMRPETRELMWRPMASTSDADGSLWYGLGWFVQYAYGTRLVWHYGIWPPSASALWLKLPEEGLSLIVLANTDGLSAPFPLGEGDVLTSAFALAFARSFVYPRRTGAELPVVDWKAPEAALVAKLGQVADPVARDLLERELWSRRQVFANAGRWDLANRLVRVRNAVFPDSGRGGVTRFAAAYGGFDAASPPTIGVWGVVWGGRAAALWFLLTAASLVLLGFRIARRPVPRLETALPWLPSVIVFGPVGLAGQLAAERSVTELPRGVFRSLRAAVPEALDCSSWHALALVAAVECVHGGASPLGLVAALIGAYLAAAVSGLLLRRTLRVARQAGGFVRALRRTALPELLETTVAAAATSAVFLLLLGFWFPAGADTGSPLLWLAIPVAAAAGALLVVPAAWWLRGRALRLDPGNERA